MPEKLDRCVKEVMKTGKSKSSAFAICNARLKKKDVRENVDLTFTPDFKVTEGEKGKFLKIGGTALKEGVSKNKINRKRTTQPSKYTYYVVKDGDSLWQIAQKHLGDGNQYSRIAQLNSNLFKEDDMIYPGMRLRLPKENKQN